MADRVSTGLIHHAYTPPDGFAAVAPGVYKASTVIFPNVASVRAREWKSKRGYTYGLHGTPTTFTLEERIATLEGGLQTLLLPSGLAAIALVNLALLKSGDELLIPDNAYGPSKELARNELTAFGIAHRLYDPSDVQGFAAMLGPKTKLLWLEAAGSVTMEFPDLCALLCAARAQGVTTALDNTWGAGVAFNAFALPGGLAVDISLQALTKYASGGADVMMGSVTTRDEALHHRLKRTHMHMGWGVGANDAELTLRSLPTLALRYAAHDSAARILASGLAQRMEIAQVLHPALPGSPGHEHWQTTCSSAAGLFSVIFDARYSSQQVDAFVDALKLFKIGYSWGGPVSLAVPYDVQSMRSVSTPYAGVLVRFSVGLEAVEDLTADLAQALRALAG